MIHVTDRFDSGNIVVLDASAGNDLRLAIRPDAGEKHYQGMVIRERDRARPT